MTPRPRGRQFAAQALAGTGAYGHCRFHSLPASSLAICRVVAIDDFPHAELVEQDVRAIFTVEPV
jgi:hypothetical protein